MTVRANNGEVLAVSPTSDVMQLESRCIRLAARDAYRTLRAKAAQLLLSAIFSICSFGHRRPFSSAGCNRVDLMKRGLVHRRDSMEDIRIRIEDVSPTIRSLYGATLEPLNNLDRVRANELANSVMMFADKSRLLVSTDGQDSKPTSSHDGDPP